MTLAQTELKNEYIRKEELVQKYLPSSTPSLYIASSGSSSGTSGYYYGVAFTTKRIVKNPGRVYDTNGNLVTATNLDANTNYAIMYQHSSGGVIFYNGSWTDDDNIHVLGAALGPSGGAWRLNTSHASYKNIGTIYTQAKYEELELVQKEIKRVTIRPNGQEKQIRPVLPDYLCFTANTANSTVTLSKSGSPTSVTLETSTNGSTWTTYSFGTAITLSSVGSKVYFRNTSTTTTGFSTSPNNYYKFVMSGSIAASGDVNYLLCKNSTDTLTSEYCFSMLFQNCSSLTSAPSLPATTLTNCCYYVMFQNCSSLTTLPELPATTLTNYCYQYMFYGCTKIKLSTTQTGEYQTAYRIPTTGTGTTVTGRNSNMFSSTGGTFQGAPTVNTTYYTSNTLV